MQEIIRLEKLTRRFNVRVGYLQKVRSITAVDAVSFSISDGETIGLVGESGCGKTTLGRMLVGLLEPSEGSFFFQGTHLGSVPRKERKEYRRKIQMVFQDPFSSLNPRMTVYDILSRPLKVFGLESTSAGKRKRIQDTLESVGLKPEHMSRYPHEFSGGQRQRIAVARSLIVDPEFLVLNEPTSALDVSVQSQILNLLKSLKKTEDLTFLLITHDLSVSRFQADRIMVMYMGRIVESAPRELLFENHRHPYTRLLLSSIPQIDPRKRRDKKLSVDEVPSLLNPPPGCSFAPRCPMKREICDSAPPPLQTVEGSHQVACYAVHEKEGKGQG